MSFGSYNNGFEAGERVLIDMPGAAFHGMEAEVLAPGPVDILEPEDVLVRNPVSPRRVLRLPESFLVKDWGRGFTGSRHEDSLRTAGACGRN